LGHQQPDETSNPPRKISASLRASSPAHLLVEACELLFAGGGLGKRVEQFVKL
jgi:hypothetical protein